MNSIVETIRIGLLRSGLELKQFLRQRESVVFTLFFPVILLFIFGTVFKDTIAPGVTFSQYFVAGMIASGLVNTGFQQLAITIPMERDDGTLKRLRGTPMSVSSYFIGKALLVTILMIIQTALLLLFGTLMFGLNLPTSPTLWWNFTWLVVLGSACSTVLGIALALLVARANPQLSAGTMTAASAMGVQKQLDYTREHEKEADRVGFQILTDAGFDGRSMVSFFNTLQRGSRFSEGAAPSFLRTHPITTDRISDISNRVKESRYRQIPDNPDFIFIKSKLRATNGTPQSAVDTFEGSIKDKRYMNEASERYGLAIAYMRKSDFVRARQEVEWLKANSKKNALIETLACKLEVSTNQPTQALNHYLKALNIYPNYRALIYGLAEHYLMTNETEKSIRLINEKLNTYPEDSYFYELLSKAYTKEGKELLQYQAQSEAYYRKFNLPRAIEQMEFATKSKDGNFYQKSIVESRLKQLKFESSFEDTKDKK
jgi:tetratricopeptide (TPR) repeat protein/ABC-type transport system involved in cytochrome c biogenesis permease component